MVWSASADRPYVNSYLMNCGMNIFEALSREIKLNCYRVW